jgi:hopene-associated glycosyltransferase HpnB
MLPIVLAGLSLIAWLYLAAFRGLFWKPLLDDSADSPKIWPSLTVVVPARDEADVLPRALPTLLQQDYPGAFHVVLVDDHSGDGTADAARALAAKIGRSDRLTVLTAPPLAAGWKGKVAAMQAGVDARDSAYVLFTDADIAHGQGSFRRLMARAEQDKLDLVSLMVLLSVASPAEKLMIPAFVFFFALLYPFRKIADPFSPVAGAAGGVMLVKRKALTNSGGLPRIKGALIDDCSLARIIKNGGGDYGAQGHIRLTLTRGVKSLRPYPSLGDLHIMIARTAFTQLGHSFLLLAGCVLGLGLLFFVPVLMPPFVDWQAGLPALAAWGVMSFLYAPTVRFYGLSGVWALTLPLATVFYLVATLDSARRTWQGVGGQWKGRAQAQ